MPFVLLEMLLAFAIGNDLMKGTLLKRAFQPEIHRGLAGVVDFLKLHALPT